MDHLPGAPSTRAQPRLACIPDASWVTPLRAWGAWRGGSAGSPGILISLCLEPVAGTAWAWLRSEDFRAPFNLIGPTICSTKARRCLFCSPRFVTCLIEFLDKRCRHLVASYLMCNTGDQEQIEMENIGAIIRDSPKAVPGPLPFPPSTQPYSFLSPSFILLNFLHPPLSLSFISASHLPSLPLYLSVAPPSTFAIPSVMTIAHPLAPAVFPKLKITPIGTSLVIHSLRIHACTGEGMGSVVWELRFYVLCSEVKRKKTF